MTNRPDARARLRALATELHLEVDDILSGASSSSVDLPMSEGVPATAPPLTAAAIRAAICDSYSAPELGVEDNERELLSQSDVVIIGGRRRLRLTDEARGAILRAASGTDVFNRLLDAASKTGGEAVDAVDAPSTWLRRFLRGEVAQLESASPAELRAAAAARERLRDAPLGPQVPTLAKTQRLLERAELLEPLRILIGAEGAWNEVPTQDRFVGRDSELRALRSFVDEIESESALESVQRGLSRAGQHVQRTLGDRRGPGTRLIVARGGLGKSALIAKFVLAHALRQTRRFPFAYLDFDRAALQPREPRQLLVEVSRQVGLQFPEVSDAMFRLRERIRSAINGGMTEERDPFDEFRDIVRGKLTYNERAFLLVLDTMEIVQADLAGLQGVVTFVERLGQQGFIELRVVAAGRADVPELLAETPSRHAGARLPLAPLSDHEAREMAQRLGQALVGRAWKAEWSARVAGKTRDDPERREPLSLRVAVETLRDTLEPERERVSRNIETMGEEAADSFVGRLYQYRVLEHVKDLRARRIAWPGLVVRRVSVDIIRDLLATPCGLDRSEAQTIFDALASEVWIVARDGEVLRHHQDLRARTLPLMRRYDRAKFDELNRAAIEYFGSRTRADPESQAEWIYHRLLGGESPSSVDADWNDALAPFLKHANEDFPPGTTAADYLAVRTADRLLAGELLQRVDPRLALLHLARTAPRKGSLSDRRIDWVIAALPLTEVRTSDLPAAALAAHVSLLVKTGRWTADSAASSVTPGVDGPWQSHAAAAIAFRRARVAVPESRWEVEREVAAAYRARGAYERAPLGALVQDLAACRIFGLPLAAQLDDVLARRLAPTAFLTDPTVGMPELRTVMVFGDRAVVAAARLWSSELTERIRSKEPLAWSARELIVLTQGEGPGPAVRTALREYGLTWEAFVAANTVPNQQARLDAPELGHAVRDAVLRRSRTGSLDDRRVLRRFAAERDEDWVVPMAYAALRASHGGVPKSIGELLERHRPVARGLIERAVLNRTSAPSDFVELIRRADEAGDIAGAARLCSTYADATDGADLQFLLNCYALWRSNIERLVDRPSQNAIV